MNNTPVKKSFNLILFVVAALAVGSGLFVAQAWLTPTPIKLSQGLLFPTAKILNEFSLVGKGEVPFTKKDLTGDWSFIFFGFTNCPDVCPTTLSTLNQAITQMEEMKLESIPRVVFVSVDPQRDNSQQLSTYVSYFNPAFQGVTGDADELTAFAKQLNAAFIVGDEDTEGSYTVDHTAALFLINPQAEMAAIFPSPHSSDSLASDFHKIIE